MLRVLYISDLYPCSTRPLAGSFHVPVFDRLQNRCDIKVIMPVMTSLLNPFASTPLRTCLADARVVTRPPAYYLPGMGGWNGRLFAAALEHPLTSLLASWRPDVVLSSFLYPAAYGALQQTERRRLPLVADAIGSDVHTLLSHSRQRTRVLHVAHHARAVVTRSQAILDWLTKAGIAAEKMTVLYNGVDHTLFRPLDRGECARALGVNPHVKRILFVGGFLPVKNLDTLVKAFSKLPSRASTEIELTLAGDGHLRGSLREQIARLGLTGSVRLTDGYVPHDELPRWLNTTDVFCLPSLNEGVPNVVLEAIACGVPVVASRVGGIPEALTEPTAGILVNYPTDVSELARALATALDRTWNRAAICQTASRFDWDATADTLYEVLSHAARN